MLRRGVIALLGLCIAVAGCGGGSGPSSSHTRSGGHRAPRPGTWTGRLHVDYVLDLAGPGAQGTITVTADGRLARLGRDKRLRPFTPRYTASKGKEPYSALSSGQRVPGAGCRWPAGNVYTLQVAAAHGVQVIDTRGRVRRFVALPSRGLENGIAFDRVGRFGHRLLITATAGASTAEKRTTLYAVGCDGKVQVLTRSAPRVEGGMVVAPPGFGRFGGDLLAPDEVSGNLYAIAPDGRAMLVARSGIAHGQDIGIESLGIVPRHYREALVADRRSSPSNPHPGDDLILGVTRATLAAAGVRPGNLLAVAEGGAETVAVSCTSSCRVRYVGAGPRTAHVEGHVAFSGRRP